MTAPECRRAICFFSDQFRLEDEPDDYDDDEFDEDDESNEDEDDEEEDDEETERWQVVS